MVLLIIKMSEVSWKQIVDTHLKIHRALWLRKSSSTTDIEVDDTYNTYQYYSILHKLEETNIDKLPEWCIRSLNKKDINDIPTSISHLHRVHNYLILKDRRAGKFLDANSSYKGSVFTLLYDCFENKVMSPKELSDLFEELM